MFQKVLLEQALGYAEDGLFVFPCFSVGDGLCTCGKVDCTSQGKHPATPGGLKDATNDPELIKEWWSTNPYHNIGIATGGISGLFVLDVDPRHGGVESLRDLEAQFGQLPPPTVTTGSGGHHYYFHLKNWNIRNSSGKLGPGLDVRGEGGYVIAPPSLHINRTQYEFDQGKILEAPEWLIHLLGATVVVRDRFELPASIQQGTRNDTLYRYACSLANSIDSSEVLASVRTVNQERCQPPLDDAALQKITKSALAFVTANPRVEPEPQQNQKSLLDDGFTFLNQVKPRKIDWLWDRHFPRGMVSEIIGYPDVGKTTFTVDFAARVSTGNTMPDGSTGYGPAKVLFLASEDDTECVLRPYLDEAGANVHNVAIRDVMVNGADGNKHQFSLTNPPDIEMIENFIGKHDIKLFIISPLSAFLGGKTDSHNDASVRAAIAPLEDLARRVHICVLVVRHPTKAQKMEPVLLGSGSLGFSAAARASFIFARNEDDPSMRYMAFAKANFVREEDRKTLAFRIISRDEAAGVAPHIEWLRGTYNISAREILAQKPNTQTDKATNLIRKMLADGPKSANEMKQTAEDSDISWPTMQKASEKMGLEKTKKRGVDGQWIWSMPH